MLVVAYRQRLRREALFRSCRDSGAATSLGVLCVTHTHKYTDRQTDRQTDTHSDTQTQTHTHTHTLTHSLSLSLSLALSLSLSLSHTHRERESIERERGREATTSLGILCVQQKLNTVDVAARRGKMHRTPLLPRRLGTRSAGIYQEAQARYAALAPLHGCQVHSLPVVVVFGCVIGAK